MKVLFVCLGNICRSPLADGLLRKKVIEQDLDIEVDSVGTAGYHIGEAPDSRMVATARRRGTDLSFLRARQFKQADFDYFDVIYVMDRSNYQNLMKLNPSQNNKDKVKLFLNELHPNQDLEVPNPYYGDQSGFDHVYDLLDQASDSLIEKIKGLKA